jgi:hypothetical protein
MDKTTGKKTIILFLIRNRRRKKDQVVDDFLTIETSERNQTGDYYNDERYRHVTNLLLVMVFFVSQDSASAINLFCQNYSHQLVREC